MSDNGTAKPKHLVIFQPSGSRGEIEAGTPVLEAARKLGVAIESTCGGRMMCSKCVVRVEEGFFERFGIESSMAHFNPVESQEQEFFRKKGITGDNYRQSCVAEIHGPAVIFVPEESRAVKQLVRKSARELKIEIKPAVKRYYVELAPASLNDPLGDWERLQNALRDEYGLEVGSLAIDYPLLTGLQEIVRRDNWKVTVSVWHNREVIRVDPGFVDYSLGIAIDVGTTTVAGYLCDLDSGLVLASESMMNPQTPFGDDVMARITYAMTNDNGLETMHRAIIEGLNTIIRRVCDTAGYPPDEIVEAVLVGNTCMDHIFLNVYPKYVGVAPFTPVIHHSVDVKARDFGLNIHSCGNVHVLPNQAGFVGADNTACVIAEEPHKQDDIMLVIDIGTNGEMVLGNRERLISTSVPTGPAFEGAQISSGMRAAPGAIEKIEIDPVTWNVRFKTIGRDSWNDELRPEEIQARGICGSGIIDLGWELYKSGVVDKTGRFSKEAHSPRLREGPAGKEFVIAWAGETAIGRDITFTGDDVRALQLAKASMYSAAKIMMRHRGVDKIDKVVLAGAFGSYIDKIKSMAMGLFPDCDFKNVYAVGNAAGDGARIALLNVDKREEANHIARHIDYIELTVDPDFEKQFAAAMHFPHMKDHFPHIDGMLNKAGHDRNIRRLRNLPHFDNLPDKTLRRLARTMEEVRFRKNKPIFRQGDTPAALYIVKEGEVGVTHQQDGHEATVATLGPGKIVGEMALIEDRPHFATAVAAKVNTRLLTIPRDSFAKLITDEPEFLLQITRELSQRLHTADETLLQTGAGPLKEETT
ncbi:MAG: ASKHA domain-containing protein [Anaerolineae bacterium]